MGGPPHVVIHVARDGFVGEGTSYPAEQGTQFLGGEGIEPHQDNSVFGDCVALRGILFGFENMSIAAGYRLAIWIRRRRVRVVSLPFQHQMRWFGDAGTSSGGFGTALATVTQKPLPR